MSPTRTRQALAAAILALAAVFASSTAAAGATEPAVEIELTMRGCSGQATLVVDGVVGFGVGGVVTEGVSWTAGGTVRTVYPTRHTPTIRLERDHQVLFAAIAADREEPPGITPNGRSFLEATLDCSTVPYTVLSINRGAVVLVPDSAMSRPGPSFELIGLLMLGLSLGAVWARGRSGRRARDRT